MDAVVVRPNTIRWRLSYWLNQKLNDFTIWIMKPLYMRWHEWWRIEEGEDIVSGIDKAYRKDLLIYTVDGLNLGFKLSPRILANAEWVKEKFKQIRWITSKDRVEYEYRTLREAFVAGNSKGFKEGYDMGKAEKDQAVDAEQLIFMRRVVKLFARKFGVSEMDITRALKEDYGDN